MNHKIIALAACVIALLPCAAGAAVTADDTCLAHDGDPATRIRACTTLLKDAAPGDRRNKLIGSRVQANTRAQHWVRALEDLQALDAAYPNDPNVHYYIAANYNGLGYSAKALPEIETAMRLGLRNADAFQIRSADFMALGRYGEALQDAEFAITSDTNVTEGFYLRGFANLETGEIHQALDDFDSAIRVDPKDTWAYFLRGRAHFALDQYDAALADFGTADKLMSNFRATEWEDNIRARMAQPSSQVAAKDADPHATVPSMAVGNTHSCDAYYPTLSNTLGESGDVLVAYDVAADGALSNIQVRKTSGVERLDRAAVICVSKHWRNLPAMRDGVTIASKNHEAIVRFITSVANTPHAMERRGSALAAMGDYQNAIAQFDLWIAAQPADANAYFNRGMAEFAFERNDDAVRDFGKAAALDPKNDDAVAGRDLAQDALLAKKASPNGGI